MNKGEKITSKWLDKLKNVKHIEIYIAIIFLSVLLLIYLSNRDTKTTSTSTTATTVTTISDYVNNLEQNLEDSLSKIGGVSNVNVMITLDMQDAEIENSKICLSKFPEIKGVLITASGAENVATKLKILHAVETLIDVKNNNVQILSNN